LVYSDSETGGCISPIWGLSKENGIGIGRFNVGLQRCCGVNTHQLAFKSTSAKNLGGSMGTELFGHRSSIASHEGLDVSCEAPGSGH
jgi:hypothetical protein